MFLVITILGTIILFGFSGFADLFVKSDFLENKTYTFMVISLFFTAVMSSGTLFFLNMKKTFIFKYLKETNNLRKTIINFIIPIIHCIILLLYSLVTWFFSLYFLMPILVFIAIYSTTEFVLFVNKFRNMFTTNLYLQKNEEYVRRKEQDFGENYRNTHNSK